MRLARARSTPSSHQQEFVHRIEDWAFLRVEQQLVARQVAATISLLYGNGRRCRPAFHSSRRAGGNTCDICLQQGWAILIFKRQSEVCCPDPTSCADPGIQQCLDTHFPPKLLIPELGHLQRLTSARPSQHRRAGASRSLAEPAIDVHRAFTARGTLARRQLGLDPRLGWSHDAPSLHVFREPLPAASGMNAISCELYWTEYVRSHGTAVSRYCGRRHHHA